MPGEELEAMIERGLNRHTESTITDRESLAAELENTRRRGYALNQGAWRAGVGGVAAPIRDFSGTVLGSVGCCMPMARLTEEALPQLAAHTMRCAAAISAELGFIAVVPPPAGADQR
jgi:IclR family acetate operon transcriptional repressor